MAIFFQSTKANVCPQVYLQSITGPTDDSIWKANDSRPPFVAFAIKSKLES